MNARIIPGKPLLHLWVAAMACTAFAADAPPEVAPAAETASTPEEVVPKAYPAERYSALLGKSPFALASAAPEVVAPVENFATNLVVTGISKKRGHDGQEMYTVFVRSRDLQTRMVITGDKPTDEGVSLVSVQEAPVAANSYVTLRKGEQTGRVEFDHSAAAASAPPAQGAQPKPGQAPRNPSAPAAARPGATAGRPPIPRPGDNSSTNAMPRSSAQAPGSSPNAAAAGGAQEPRRRVRPIQEPP